MIDKEYIKKLVNAQNQIYFQFDRFVAPAQLIDNKTSLISKKTLYKKFVKTLENDKSVFCSKTGKLTFGSECYVLLIFDYLKNYLAFDKVVFRKQCNFVSLIHDNHFFHQYFIEILYFDDSNIHETVDKYIELNEKYKEISKQNFEYHIQNETIENYFNKFSQGKTKQEINEIIKFTNRMNYCIKDDSGKYNTITLSEVFAYCDDDLKCKLNKRLSYSISYGTNVDMTDASITQLDDVSFRKLRNFACSIFFEKEEQHCFSNFNEKIQYFTATQKLYSLQCQFYLHIIADFSQKQLQSIINHDCRYSAIEFSPCVTLFDKIKIYFDVEKDHYWGNNVPRFTFKSVIEKSNWLDFVVG